MNLFRNFLANAQLRDLNYQGSPFTWFSLRNKRISIKERLDRCLGNSVWCVQQAKSQVFHLPKLGSDHRPILLDTHPTESKSPPIFRFEHIWTTKEECYSVIHSN